MIIARQFKLLGDFEKIKRKYVQVKTNMKCMKFSELEKLKQLEVFSSPYAQDLKKLMKNELEKTHRKES